MSLRTSRFVESLFAAALIVTLTACGGSSPTPIPPPPVEPAPTTPIHHVIIVIGENHGFDNVFATYQPADPAQHVWNLLSQGIVNASGDPGPNYSMAAQQQAMDTDVYRVSPSQTGAYATLPQPSTAVQPLLLSFAEQFSIASDPGLA